MNSSLAPEVRGNFRAFAAPARRISRRCSGIPAPRAISRGIFACSRSASAGRRFLDPRPVTIPVLLDPGREVTKARDISTLSATFMLDEMLTPGRTAIGGAGWDGPMTGRLFSQISPRRPATHSGSAP